MKTNKSYKLVLHKKGFGGSGKQEHTFDIALIHELIIFIHKLLKDLIHLRLFKLTFPLCRWRVGCQPKSLPSSQFKGYNRDCTPHRWIQASLLNGGSLCWVFFYTVSLMYFHYWAYNMALSPLNFTVLSCCKWRALKRTFRKVNELWSNSEWNSTFAVFPEFG